MKFTKCIPILLLLAGCGYSGAGGGPMGSPELTACAKGDCSDYQAKYGEAETIKAKKYIANQKEKCAWQGCYSDTTDGAAIGAFAGLPLFY